MKRLHDPKKGVSSVEKITLSSDTESTSRKAPARSGAVPFRWSNGQFRSHASVFDEALSKVQNTLKNRASERSLRFLRDAKAGVSSDPLQFLQAVGDDDKELRLITEARRRLALELP